MVDDKALIVDRLKFEYTSGNIGLGSEVSFTLNPGDTLAVFGPNGSGKTTLLKTIAGVHEPMDGRMSGRVKVLGSELSKMSSSDRARALTYFSGESFTEFPLTAEQVVQLSQLPWKDNSGPLSRTDPDQVVTKAMQEAGCIYLRKRLFRSLSLGERQLVLFSKMLAQGGKILLLDELFSHLDIKHYSSVAKRIQDLAHQGAIVIAVSHDLGILSQLCEKILILGGVGGNYFGSISELYSKNVLQQMFPESRFSMSFRPDDGKPHLFLKI